MTVTLSNSRHISSPPSVDPWSATMIRSAKTLVTSRNRRRIHASFFSGVRTTMEGLPLMTWISLEYQRLKVANPRTRRERPRGDRLPQIAPCAGVTISTKCFADEIEAAPAPRQSAARRARDVRRRRDDFVVGLTAPARCESGPRQFAETLLLLTSCSRPTVRCYSIRV